MINKELQKRLDNIEKPNQELLTKLLEDIESLKQKEEIRNSLRTNIREYVAKEMNNQ